MREKRKKIKESPGVTVNTTTDTDYTNIDNEGVNDYLNNKKNKISSTYEVPQTVYDLLGFISGMKKIAYEYPYMMQSISGLDEAYKKYFSMKDPFQGSGDDKITITCYEALDLRVSSMFNKYLNACYDHQYKRERLPINLRRFQCSVFVHDIRNFRSALSKLYSEDDSVDDSSIKIAELAKQYASVVEFKFFDCEIVPSETGGLFESITNLPSNDARKTKFTFTYGNCVVNFLPFEDLRKYVLNKTIDEIKPGELNKNLDVTKSGELETEHNENKPGNSYVSLKEAKANTNWGERRLYTPDDGNFRRWFD